MKKLLGITILAIMACLLVALPALAAPTVTSSVANVTSPVDLSATLNGEIIATGNGNSVERGFVWDTVSRADPGNTAPGDSAYADSWTETGSFGISSFDYLATGLTELTKYYYRACADAGGTGDWDYSDEREFFMGEDGKVYRGIRPDLDETLIRGNAGIPTDARIGEVFWGYSLPIWSDLVNVNEEMYYQLDIPDWWDGDSDFLVHIHMATSGDESGKAYGVQLAHDHSTPNVVEAFPIAGATLLTQNRLVGSALTYAHYMEIFVLDYDHDLADIDRSDDILGFRIRRIANELQETELDGELIIVNVEVYFAEDRSWVDEIIEEDIEIWMEEAMEEIGIQFEAFNVILASWDAYILLVIGLLIVAGFVALAWWHRDPYFYIVAGFAFILYGFAFWDTSWYLSLLFVVAGALMFFKASYEFRERKKRG